MSQLPIISGDKCISTLKRKDPLFDAFNCNYTNACRHP